MIDGASLLRHLHSIVLPVMAPGLIATSIFVAILSWSEIVYAPLFIQSPDKYTRCPRSSRRLSRRTRRSGASFRPSASWLRFRFSLW